MVYLQQCFPGRGFYILAVLNLMVPLLIFYVVGLGLLMKQDVFGDF